MPPALPRAPGNNMTGIMVSTLASGSMKFDAPTISARQTAAAVTRNLCHQPTATGAGSAGRLAHYVVRRKTAVWPV